MSGLRYWKGMAVSALILLLVIAAWSRISKMEEPAKIIKGGASGVSALFRGVFK